VGAPVKPVAQSTHTTIPSTNSNQKTAGRKKRGEGEQKRGRQKERYAIWKRKKQEKEEGLPEQP
jgi:hypothetical protein